MEIAANSAPTRAVRVTFFEDRAEVVRRGRAVVSAGSAIISFTGVSPFIDDRTVQAKLISPAGAVSAVRVKWRVEPQGSDQRTAQIEAETREFRREAEGHARAEQRAAADLAQSERLVQQWIHEVNQVARGFGSGDARERWQRAWREVAEASERALAEIAKTAGSKADAEERARRAMERLAALREEAPIVEATIEAELSLPDRAEGGADAEVEVEVEVELTYRVPCALWRPEHSCALAGNEIVWTTWAVAWHAAGEAWDDVTARFSTARTSRDASPPLVTDDVLFTRRKSDEERHRVVVEARDQTIATAGLDRGTTAADEMPGVDDGGEPLTYEAKDRVTIAGNGRPIRIEIERRSLPIEVDRILYPEIANIAHHRGTATLRGAPILAGPVAVSRAGAFVGRNRVGFVAPGEPFEVGLGPDDAVRCRRRIELQLDTTSILGTQKIRRRVRVFLSNLSGEKKTLTVVERIPVIEIEGMEVKVTETGGFSLDRATGHLKLPLSLAARETKEVSFSYEIKASSNIVLPA